MTARRKTVPQPGLGDILGGEAARKTPRPGRPARAPLSASPDDGQGYVSAGEREASGYLRAIPVHPPPMAPAIEQAYLEARERGGRQADVGALALDAEGRETSALLAAGWRRAPWQKLGAGSSDWLAPDGRRVRREDAVRELGLDKHKLGG